MRAVQLELYALARDDLVCHPTRGRDDDHQRHDYDHNQRADGLPHAGENGPATEAVCEERDGHQQRDTYGHQGHGAEVRIAEPREKRGRRHDGGPPP